MPVTFFFFISHPNGNFSVHMCARVQGDGREEVVACAWDGQTYIIDHNRTVVRFQFDENVNAFCAGDSTVSLVSIDSRHHELNFLVTTTDSISWRLEKLH